MGFPWPVICRNEETWINKKKVPGVVQSKMVCCWCCFSWRLALESVVQSKMACCCCCFCWKLSLEVQDEELNRWFGGRHRSSDYSDSCIRRIDVVAENCRTWFETSKHGEHGKRPKMKKNGRLRPVDKYGTIMGQTYQQWRGTWNIKQETQGVR